MRCCINTYDGAVAQATRHRIVLFGGDAYEYRGKRRELAPLDADGWDECKPVYLEFPGWDESTAGIRDWNKLPPAARAYLRAIEELSGCRLAIVATGADRDDTIVLDDPFA